jgi:hypothetical protein
MLWTGRPSRRRAWFQFFVLHTRCIILRLVALRIHKALRYLARRQQTGPFNTRSLINLRFAANENATTTTQIKLCNYN